MFLLNSVPIAVKSQLTTSLYVIGPLPRSFFDAFTLEICSKSSLKCFNIVVYGILWSNLFCTRRKWTCTSFIERTFIRWISLVRALSVCRNQFFASLTAVSNILVSYFSNTPEKMLACWAEISYIYIYTAGF